eukprot:TRINITY_DN30893_c0_g1_i1.p1 TRINITY_DN30893_c0_g1~~TRINITY_DN30893_c0_g1_i1.p1  ORF type:complete len:406 (+),score=91.50 TRINITY_DN30893_c0_g1_i1:264-1481(+)
MADAAEVPAVRDRLEVDRQVIRRGSHLLIRHQGDLEWHERLVSAVVDGSHFVGLSPDEDHYVHSLGDIEMVRAFEVRPTLAQARAAVDAGAYLHRFQRGYRDRARERIFEEGRQLAAAFAARQPREAGAPVAADEVEAAGAGEAIWVSADPTLLAVGSPVRPLVTSGDWGIAEVREGDVTRRGACCRVKIEEVPQFAAQRTAAMRSALSVAAEKVDVEDARVLTIERQSGRRVREWPSVVEACSEEAFEDWPISGPRTVAWCLRFLKRRHTPLDHHLAFKSSAKLQSDQWGVQEHEFLLRVVETAGSYDQLDLSNCAWAESVFRRLQTIEWAYHDKVKDSAIGTSGRLDAEEMVAFAGQSKAGDLLMVAPTLLDHVKGVVEKDAVILKNLRKAREERLERRKEKK